MIIFLDTFVRNNKLCTTYYVALSYIFAIMFIYVSTIFVSVVISHQEILYTCDRRGRFVYVYVHCTCTYLESCSSLISQIYYLTIQHDNGSLE